MSVQMFPRTLADQNRKIVMLVDPVNDMSSIPADELNSALELSCRATQADTRFAPSASESISDPAVCEDSGASTLGASQWEGTLGLFRFFDAENPGQGDPEGDQAYDALKVKGTVVTIVERHTNKPWDTPFEAGDEIRVFRVEADNWTPSAEQHTGYIKGTFPMAVQAANQHAVVGADTGNE